MGDMNRSDGIFYPDEGPDPNDPVYREPEAYPDKRFTIEPLDFKYLPRLSMYQWVHSVDDDDIARLDPNCKSTGFVAWIRDQSMLPLKRAIMILLLSAMANGWCTTIMPGLLNIESFRQMFSVNEKSNQPLLVGLTISSLSIGSMIGVLPSHYLALASGRRICITIGSALMLAGALVGALVPSTYGGPENARWIFIGLRAVIGIGLGISQAAVPALVAEIAHPQYRGSIMLWYNVLWYWGGALGALTTVSAAIAPEQELSWRIPYALQAVIPLIQLLGLLFGLIPESPRILILQNRPEAAAEFILKYHCKGRKDDIVGVSEFYQMMAMHREESRHGTRKLFKAFFTTPGNRRRLWIILLVAFLIQWTGNGVISFYISQMLQFVGVGNTWLGFGIWIGLQFFNGIVAGLGGYLCEKLPRRPLWFWTSFLMFLTMCGIAGLATAWDKELNDPNSTKSGTPYGIGLVILFFLFFAIYDLAFTPLQIGYLNEILPYSLRSRGIACNWFFVFLNGAIAQFMHPILLEHWKWKIYYGYCGILFIWTLSILLWFPETFNMAKLAIELYFDNPEIGRKLHITFRSLFVMPKKQKTDMGQNTSMGVIQSPQQDYDATGNTDGIGTRLRNTYDGMFGQGPHGNEAGWGGSWQR